MKKYLTAMIAACSIMFMTSCDDDTDPGGTTVMKMAGDWWVTVDFIDESGINHGDLYNIGHIQMYTYNTAVNKATEMWIEDGAHFWDYKLKVDVQYENRTFSTAGFVENQAYESKVSIIEGKIMEGVATTPSGMPADSIVYFIQFDDDDPGITYKISGFRRTGFPADDF